MITTQIITNENFESKISATDLCLIDIWAPWCGPCKQLGPIIDEVSVDVGDNVLVGKLNADDNMDICKKYNVRNIPTILLFKNGEVVDRTSGLKSKKEILEMVEKYTNVTNE